MSDAKRPPGIVPRVFSEDGGGYSRPAKCAHCGKQFGKGTRRWVNLAGDPNGPAYLIHAMCHRGFRAAARLPGV